MTNRFYSNVSGAGGANNGTSWANAYQTIAAAIAGLVAGDTLWVGDDNNESLAVTTVLTFPGTNTSPNFIYVVDHTIASPGTANLKIGAAGAGSISTTGATNLEIGGCLYWYGAYLSAGSGANATDIFVPNNNATSWMIFENSKLVNGGTAGGGFGMFVGCTTDTSLEFRNVTLKFGGTADSIRQFTGTWWWHNTTQPAIDVSAGVPSNVFHPHTTAVMIMEALDFSPLGSGGDLFANPFDSLVAPVLFKDCLLSSGSVMLQPNPMPYLSGWIDIVRSDQAAVTRRTEHWDGVGGQILSTAVVRTGGASDGTNLVAWLITTSARTSWFTPFLVPSIAIWNTVVGANRTVTIEGIADPRDFSALPNNDDVWMDVEYMGNATTLGAVASGTKANGLATGTPLAASTSAWDSAATARANSFTYSAGAIIKVASNPGRLFVCTTGGQSAGSEPGGYASAVDGGTVVDNAATFKAMWRFKQSITLSSPQPQLAGTLYGQVKVAKPSLNGIYIDPLLTLS